MAPAHTLQKAKVLASFLLILAVGAAASKAAAQSPGETQRIKNAETLIYSGRCGDAVVQLRPLYDAEPQNERVALSLKNAYVCLKEYDSARVILERLIARAPFLTQEIGYRLELSAVYFRAGDEAHGRQTVDEAVTLGEGNLQYYEQAADVFIGSGYYADGVKFLQESRRKLGQPRAFARKLAQVYEILRNYGDAAREYFAVVQQDTAQEVMVSGKVAALIKLDAQEEFDTGLGEALAEILASNPRNAEAQRYYGDYLVAQGDFAAAFDRFRMVDSLAQGKGRYLLYFARAARDNGVHEMVHRACALIETIPNSPYLVQAQFLLAETHAAAGEFAQAAELYGKIIAGTPNDRDRTEAFFSLGHVQLYGLHDPRAAIATLGGLIERYPRSPLAAAGKVVVADAYLALGQAGVADSLYAQIELKSLPQRNQEELLYKQAELQFFTGNFSLARDAYSRMMNTYPKSVFVNDCLRRMMLITEYAGMDEATLQIYSNAAYAQFRFEYQTALELLDKLKYRESKILPELAWLTSGEILATLGRDTLALAAYDTLVQLRPESFYAPLAIERKGDIYAHTQKNCEMARTTYQQVILNYPKSLNVEDVRKKLWQTERILCARTEKPKS